MVANVGLWGKDLTTGKARPLRSGDTATDEAGNPITAGSLAALVAEGYLPPAAFKIVTGLPSCDTTAPDVAGLGETLDYVKGNATGQVAHMIWQGRLWSSQTLIDALEIGIQGTGNYRLKVYVEAAGPTWILGYDSGSSAAAPGSLTFTTISSFSHQPIGKGRFLVVVEATVDSGEIVNATRPYYEQQ